MKYIFFAVRFVTGVRWVSVGGGGGGGGSLREQNIPLFVKIDQN